MNGDDETIVLKLYAHIASFQAIVLHKHKMKGQEVRQHAVSLISNSLPYILKSRRLRTEDGVHHQHHLQINQGIHYEVNAKW